MHGRRVAISERLARGSCTDKWPLRKDRKERGASSEVGRQEQSPGGGTAHVGALLVKGAAAHVPGNRVTDCCAWIMDGRQVMGPSHPSFLGHMGLWRECQQKVQVEGGASV